MLGEDEGSTESLITDTLGAWLLFGAATLG